MTTYHWSLPFGAEKTANGFIFKLWAPAASRVELRVTHLDESQSALAMEHDNGWFHLTTKAVTFGDLYGFSIDERVPVPDPASRYQPFGVHDLSQLMNPEAYHWQTQNWSGRPWREAVIYELHIGTFTQSGTFQAAIEKLPFLHTLGVTAIELLPIAAFPGDRGWGYDGVQQYAPYAPYGSPDDLKAFIDAAHELKIMVLLDVVYNHFGPEGNYLPQYAPDVKSKKYATSWGEAFNYESPRNGRFMRDFIINNSLYWLEEFRFDGLRFDAVQAIHDNSELHVMQELAGKVHAGPGKSRHIWLIQENCANNAEWFERDASQNFTGYHGQWNDDFHHAVEVMGKGERGGVYSDFADAPSEWMARILAEGFGYQGERSGYFDKARGTASQHLPPVAMINFLENHDQVANRPACKRITHRLDNDYVRVATEMLLLMPTIPMLFMGQEWAASTPFTFFCDLDSWLMPSVSRGRKKEVEFINGLQGRLSRKDIPEPDLPKTFSHSVLNWMEIDEPKHQQWLKLHQKLLAVRAEKLVPLLDDTLAGGFCHYIEEKVFYAQWPLNDNKVLSMCINLSSKYIEHEIVQQGEFVYQSEAQCELGDPGYLAPFSISVFLDKQVDERF